MISGITLAVMTKNTEKRANNFTFGNVSIELTETEWDKLTSGDKIVYSNKVISKNPVVTNTGNSNLYAYIEVKVPMATVKTVNEDETINDAKLQNLLTYEIDKNNWTLINEDTSKDNAYSLYIYVYNKVLSPNESSQVLFNEITYINMLEGELKEDATIEMPITAYAIQSDCLSSDDNFKSKETFDKYFGS